jgi:Recombination endonuclease VII
VKPAGIVVPAPATLRKYGLDVDSWSAFGEAQGWRCPCGRVPGTGKFNIDHEHVRGWKAMKPEDRRRYVRGLVCWTCNMFTLAKGATAERLRRLADYLDAYAGRKFS